jgi:ArsR family transcriptional regulator, arsenate/arsenite/antimonite-responsive transcriptional repressor
MNNIFSDAEQQAALFKTLADPTRLKLVKLLYSRPSCGPLCVNAVAGLLGISQSAVSQHLRLLKAIGLVKGERKGYHIHYHIDNESLKECQDTLFKALSFKEDISECPCGDHCHEKQEPKE